MSIQKTLNRTEAKVSHTADLLKILKKSDRSPDRSDSQEFALAYALELLLHRKPEVSSDSVRIRVVVVTLDIVDCQRSVRIPDIVDPKREGGVIEQTPPAPA